MSSPILLLDVMSTIVREPWFEDAPVFFGMTIEELHAAKHPTAWIEFEKGDLEEQAFLDGFFRDKRDFDQQGFIAHLRKGYRFLPGMDELLAELAAARVPMHALSNYPVWYRSIEADLELSRFLEWSFVSCKTGVRKPSPSAYQAALDTLDVRADACVFVDDMQENVDAACALGMDGILFEGSKALRRSLKTRGLPVRVR